MKQHLIPTILGLALGFAAVPAFAAAEGAPHLDGATLGIVWTLPFVGILLSIAVMPLAAAHFWHHHYGKAAAAWALAFVLPFALIYGFDLALYEVLHTLLLEYIPFIILLFALFTVAGGIYVRGNLHGSPGLNTGFLAVGTVIASWTGTTGAAMLLIRPLMRANDARRHNAHVVIFFIFLVANIGGSLTPLGDPPLFLGFLKGVDFFWPTVHLFLPMLVAGSIVLAIFYLLDRWYYAREENLPPRPDPTPDNRVGIEGGINILLLGGIVGAVLLSGAWKPGIGFAVYHVTVELQNLVRDLLLLGIAGASMVLTRRDIRAANGFTWGPILEVAKLFAGIFLTIIPAIAILKAGTGGALGPLVSLVSGPGGEPNNIWYFWLTGTLSSFLDNAPTYLVFFNMAGGDPQALMGPLAATLTAISAGAVFMGANTYIGNAPNFMVKAIAEENGVKMPSFFGYMAWSSVVLIPVFVLVTLIFFV
ncbi:sodium:proton antiporter [Desertibaculum subflavum]|uniref:sodium:proton antiporter n=1 Tax=Desertibaculum subflavum TaxID=2268458 RepID=UPI003F67E648